MVGYRLFWKDRLGRRGEHVDLLVRLHLECLELCLGKWTGAFGYYSPDARLCISFCCTSWVFPQPKSPACPSERQHNHLVNQPLPVLHRLQTHWGCTVPLYRTFMKVRGTTCSSVNPCGTPLVACLQLDLVPLITTLWTLLVSQFSIHHIVYLPNLYLVILCMKVLSETVSKFLLKPTICCPLLIHTASH